MATWITHLRIAGLLLDRYPWLDADAFLLGSIAPDSGVPTGDGIHYTPDKAVSHFRMIDEAGVKHFRTDVFADRYLTAVRLSCRDISFLLGYIAHLTTDAVWGNRILAPLTERFPDEYQHNKAAFFSAVKRDWYDLDFLYLKAHPDFVPLRRYLAMADVTNRWLDFFSPDAFALRRDYIRTFYEEGVKSVQSRSLVYLTADALDAFVIEAAEAVCTELAPLFASFSDSVQ